MKRIGIFTSGGDAPGMNACIRAAVRTAVYKGIEIYGIRRGDHGMLKGDIIKMDARSVRSTTPNGGTSLRWARSKELIAKEGRQEACDQLQAFGMEGLVAIGGAGTFTGAN